MSTAWNAGKFVWEKLWWLFDNINEFWKSIPKAWATWLIDVWTWVIRSAWDAVDIIWDAAAHATDFVTWAWAELFGWQWTDLANKQMFLDKASDKLNENLLQERKDIRKALYWDETIWVWWEIANIVGWILAPWAIMKLPKYISAVKKVLPFIDKVDDATKLQVIKEIDTLKKSWNLTKDAINWLYKKYWSNIGTINEKVIDLWADAEKAIKSVDPSVITTLIQKYPKIGKVVTSPKLFAEWAKSNPKKAATILGSIQQIWVRLDSEMPQPDNVEKAETSLNNVESAMDQVETPNKEGPTKTEQNMSKNPAKKIGELNAEVQAKNKHLNVWTSIADNMKALWINNAYEARQALYENLYGEPYTWSAEQNIKLKTKIEDYSVEEISNLIKSRSPNL